MEIERGFVFDPSLALYLPLYKLDGASFISKDAYSHLCTVTGAIWRLNGHYFDGMDDEIVVGNPTALNNLGSLSILAWINPDTLGKGNYGRIADKRANGWHFALLTNNRLAFYVDYTTTDLGVYSPNNSITLGSYQHVAVAWDGSTTATNAILYVNGTALSRNSDTNGAGARQDDSARSLRIGNNVDDSYVFDGVIGEVLIYNRALTPLEIQHNYLATKWRYR